MRQLVIEQSRTHSYEGSVSVIVEVDDHMFIGSLISTVAIRFGYRLVDSFGVPIAYQLRSVSDNTCLPMTGLFADIPFPSGSRFVLEMVANNATIPMNKGKLAFFLRRRVPLSRRLFISLSGISLLGLGTGVTTAFAQQTLHQSAPPMPPLLLMQQRIFSKHEQPVRTVAWSADDTMLASGGDDARVFMWHIDGTVVHTLSLKERVRGLAWSGDAEQLMVGSGKAVSFFDTSTATLLTRAERQHFASVTAVKWAQREFPLAVSVSEDKRAIVWNGQTHTPQFVFQQHTASIEAVDIDNDVVATASVGGLVRVWSARNGKEVHGYFSDTSQSLRSVAFSSNGDTLAFGSDSGEVYLHEHGIFCTQEGPSAFGIRCLDRAHSLPGHRGAVQAVAFSPDGTLLATGGEDGLMRIWSVQHRVSLLIQPLPGAVSAIAWSASGQLLAVAAGKVVTLWQLQRSKQSH